VLSQTLLQVTDLRTYFFTEAGIVKAVDGVQFSVREGETLGLVGESGGGKTVSALSVLRIVPRPGKIVAGKILFDGANLLEKKESEMRPIRGRQIAMIFQDPSSSLNPVLSIERQLREIVVEHERVTKREAMNKVVEMFELVGIPEPETRIRGYPHEFSGGMRQRVAIARALLLRPRLLFADEPTTNLDVTIQAQVLDLMKSLRSKFHMSMVLITHDMGIVAEMAERVVVLYAGQVCEIADTRALYSRPRHPYTEALLGAVPRLDTRKELRVIPGSIPNLIEAPSGCRFHPRCTYARDICHQRVPTLEEVEPGHLVHCHRWREIELAGEAGRPQR
jgi:oligopeptide/dipeptide ABC transporter ATP-binding protein